MSAKETVKEVVGSHNLIRIATIASEGVPGLRSVDYASGDSENIFYFITQKDSSKVKQIKENGNVAVTVDRDCKSWEELQKLKYIKGTGTATIIQDPEKMQKAFGLIMNKFPYLKDLPGDPSDFVGIKVELKEIQVTDNTISFGHTETVTY
ncbi:MAG: pyridoxamine 5'-phosphate oxidase family protein [Deltaproteobacteria bacterium]|nr:pyridoxamine 5'-phosphate oxidase family protein [Deltaproteobacteria bacterium]